MKRGGAAPAGAAPATAQVMPHAAAPATASVRRRRTGRGCAG